MSTNTTSPPTLASAVGYDTETFGPNVTLGSNWLPYGFDGSNPASLNATQNADGSLTIAGGVDTWNGQISTATPGGNGYVGEVFGGGFYAQATISAAGATSGLLNNGPNEFPAFWSNSVAGYLGTGTNVEADFMEMDMPSPGQYGYNLTNWSWRPGGYGIGNSEPVANTGANLSQPNTYGFLWVPATATTQGSATWYFNGQQVGTTSWSQGQGPYSALDGQQLTLILGAGANVPMTVSNVQVWQTSSANDSVNGSPAPLIGGSPSGGSGGNGGSTSGGSGGAQSPNDTVVMAGSTAAITDAAGNKWTITGGAQVAVNGTVDAVTANVTELAYVNGTIWQENSAKMWWGETAPNDAWANTQGTATSPLPATPPPPVPSANDTVVMAGSAAAITDAAGNKWTISSGAQVAVNGTVDAVTANVTELAYVNGTIWQENSAKMWWGETAPNDAWANTQGTATSPLPATPPPPVPSANDTVVMAGSAAAITDAAGNKWTITGGAQVAVNGTVDAVTANVTELAYVNGTIWQENSAKMWWGETAPNDAWANTQGTATSPLPATPPPPVASANDTVVMAGSAAAITDAAGNKWTISSGAQVAVNGTVDAVTANVTELAYVNGTIWQENSAKMWWGETAPNDAWANTQGTATSPLPATPPPPVASANDTVVMAGSAAAITDAAGNKWTITGGAQVAVNGTVDAVTANVTELAYVNGTIWQENSAKMWWGETAPNDAWANTQGTATSPLPTSITITIAQGQASATVSLSHISINATAGTHMVLISGTGDTVKLSGGTDTVTDTGGGNSYVIPTAGKGYDVFTNDILTVKDTLDLRPALAATNWAGTTSTLSSYLSVIDSAKGAVLSIAPTSGGTGVAVASINGATTTSLAALLARAVT